MGVNGPEPIDQGLGGWAEDVVVRDLAPFLRLDPFRAQPVEPAPRCELRAHAYDVEKRLLSDEATDR